MTEGQKNILGDTALSPHNAVQSPSQQVIADSRGEPVEDSDFGVGPSMNRFFADRNKTFWTLQIAGWIGYMLVRFLNNVTLNNSFAAAGAEGILIVAAGTIGFSMTTGLRFFYRNIREMSLAPLIGLVTLVVASLGVVFSFIEIGLAPFIFPDFGPIEGFAWFGNAMFEATVLFAWTAIYFGYHYYLGFLEQQERALKATAMAHQAQLTMLRYQLNPHFLFNTLNAISTLVLEKSGSEANKMLTKLSSFLRYTLVNQPTQRISLDQELQATGLYLDIEKVRFGERLHIDFDIDDAARTALVPSLILQPLVENAIKYAVAPEIDGGTITICAKLVDRKLKITLRDTGPGLPDLDNIVSQSGSGVGIVNTKERLSQLYGETHEFRLENLEPAGLGIFITLPAERSNRATF